MVFKYLVLTPFCITGILIACGDPDDNMKNNSERRIARSLSMPNPVPLSQMNKQTRFRSKSDLLTPQEENPSDYVKRKNSTDSIATIPLHIQNQISKKKPRASGATQ